MAREQQGAAVVVAPGAAVRPGEEALCTDGLDVLLRGWGHDVKAGEICGALSCSKPDHLWREEAIHRAETAPRGGELNASSARSAHLTF